MTIELTYEQLYSGILALLILLQAWHHYRLTKHIEQNEVYLAQVWLQISTLTTTISAKLVDMEKKLNEKVGKQGKND